ncbi:hypothetical protein EV196_103317 [Mariniflexile fucanivorans]|uniref:Parallel beta helix pectate lyase-like protein n=1 Tax=Mariniflexile fucanivorans TaxID=264023 RepID=A0A4V2QE80_9FLAO|nr:hypothetical protein [Mariniflexile fucanivorans]TCL66897.1 hypothetical protein EV196_103317 [Mariniflexile fucanivorans]
MKHLLTCFLFLLCMITYAQTTYFVDDVTGKDSNNGKAKTTPFKSLSSVNQLHLKPGDSVLFKRNGNWQGNLIPQGSGKKGQRIVIGAYGKGDAPKIDAQGRKQELDSLSATIRLYNQEFWEIRDIEVQNFEKGNPQRPVKKAGILVLAKDIGTLNDFKFENLKISNVNGSLRTRENGGLFLNIIADTIPEKRVPTNFDGVYINNCYFLNVDRGGFLNQSVWKTRDLISKFGEISKDGKVNNWFPSKNILIQNCKFEEIGGNGLVTRVCDVPIVQNNLFVRCSTKTTGNASYPYNCDNALWQYNEACYTVYNEGDIDASGFDSDYLCKNTIIQYNYSHHNDWGGLLVCSWGKLKNAFNDGTVIRNNIFQDEKHHMIRFSGNITNTEISNNLFVTTAEVTDVMLWYKHWGGIWPTTTTLKNNIFYNSGTQKFLNLGETASNSILDNTLEGTPFSDFSNFKSSENKKALDVKIQNIRSIGNRQDFSVSKAKEVTDMMWDSK